MAVISLAHNFLFLQIPRTGCTSISNDLIKHDLGTPFPPTDMFDRNGKLLIEQKHDDDN